jgi:hypothetical protein
VFDAEHVLAVVGGLVGLVIGGYYLWTGKFAAGLPNRPLWNLIEVGSARPLRLHPLTTRFIALVIVGLSVLLLVRVFS